MIKAIDYSEIDEKLIKDNYVLIDVRSPGEFLNASIPGAVNIPLFTDEQREHIGTVYVQESVEKAKKLGIEAAAKNLPIIYEKIQQLQQQYKSLIFFCAKGGMRSSSMVSLLITIGVNAFKIRGGYKFYRAYINKNLPKVIEEVQFIVIHGNTGVGKTNILKKLKEAGYDVLDLEGSANHRGSLLGNIGLGDENSQKQFESLIYEAIKERKSNLVFVEGESKRIGDIIIPGFIFNAMEKGVHINVTAALDFRVKNIMKDYVENNNQEIIEALNKLRKYINCKNVDRYIEDVKKHSYDKVIEELMVKYYDPMYENTINNYELNVENTNSERTCDVIINWLKDKF